MGVSFNLKYKCGFYSPITLIQSGQTHKQTHKQTQQSSFNNIDIVVILPNNIMNIILLLLGRVLSSRLQRSLCERGETNRSACEHSRRAPEGGMAFQTGGRLYCCGESVGDIQERPVHPCSP